MSAAARPAAVIFDLDGVLVDSAEPHRQSWRALGRELGIEVRDEDFLRLFGRTSRDIVPQLFGADLSPEEIRGLGQRKEALYRGLIRGRVPAMPGAAEAVRRCCDAGCRLAIGSSTPRANIDLALDGLGVAALFDAIVSGDEVSRGKPDPEVFLTAAARLGIEPHRCLVVEDAPAGIQAALAGGMQAVALCSTHPAGDFPAGAQIITTLAELLP